MNKPQVGKHIADLKDRNHELRSAAADALGKVGDASAVPALIEALKDTDPDVRERATEALAIIGDASAVPALMEALKDENKRVRRYAASALGKIGDASAVPALIEALKGRDHVRPTAASALGKIGALALAVPVLIKALKDKNRHDPRYAASSLDKIGDSVTLPRKILANVRWSAQERINVLEELRSVHEDYPILFYTFPETRALCQTVLNEEDAEARKGAQTVLYWLDTGQHLLHATQRDPTTEGQELLRAAQGRERETKPETLPRASDEPEESVFPVPPRPALWQRIFAKRSGGTL